MKNPNYSRRKILKVLISGLMALRLSVFAQTPKELSASNLSLKDFNLPLDIHPTFFKIFEDKIFVSDAYKKRIYCFSKKGELIWESQGEDKFAIPCDKFPLDISPEGELWVANTGKHRLENLDVKTGKFIASWKPQKEFELRGCCNPMAFVCLGLGSFALMEKGAFELRIFEASGRALRTLKIEKDWERYEISFDEKKSELKFFDGENRKEIKI